MTLKPLADNVVIKGVEEEKTAGGLILATANKEKPVISTVLAVGPGTEEHPMTVKVGDKVVVAKYAGSEIKLDGETVCIVRVSDVLAIAE